MPTKRVAKKSLIIGGYKIVRDEIPLFLTEEFWRLYEHWENFHYLHVLPNGGGTLDENPWTVRIIKEYEKVLQMIIDDEQRKALLKMKAEQKTRK